MITQRLSEWLPELRRALSRRAKSAAVETAQDDQRGVLPIAIDTLTGLRAVAALWVVVYHFRFDLMILLPWTRWIEPLMAAGFIGVETFFVLSGFIIAYNYADQLRTLTWSTYSKYVYMRLARVYPVHAVTLLMFGVVFAVAAKVGASAENPPDGGPLGFMSNVVMLQGLPPGQFTWNGPAWTPTYEWLAYLVFPVLVLLLERIRSVRGFIALAVLAMTVAGVGLTVMGLAGVELTRSHAPEVFRIIGGFVSGVAIYVLYRLKAGADHRWDLITILAGMSMISVLFGCVYIGVSSFIVLPLVVVAVYGIAHSRGPIRKALAGKMAVYAGTTSYSLYMTHIFTLVVLHRTLPVDRLADDPLWVRLGVVLVYLKVTMIGGMLMYHLVEKPARTWMRKSATGSRGMRSLGDACLRAFAREHPLVSARPPGVRCVVESKQS